MARPSTTDSPPAFGEPELLAVVTILLCLVHGWLARAALNPDGVSYLDLASALAHGRWSAFVQGYWSPLYPALIGIATAVTGADRIAAVNIAHAINTAAAIGAALILWRWSRAVRRPMLSRALFAALLLASNGLPRIEGVTPDVLLLLITTWIAYEMLVHRSARWIRLGVLLGAAFLVKTSWWPVLALSIPLRLWAAHDADARRRALKSSALGILVVLAWIVPMSAEAGRPTLGSSGRLNWCWFIKACDGQTPDGHGGAHRQYRARGDGAGHVLEWAEYADADTWTYEPWSDPTAWQAGVLTQRFNSPTAREIVRYWGWQAAGTFGLWMLPVIAGVLIPFGAIYWRRDVLRRLLDDKRSAIAVVLLGLAGVFQFIMVVSQPRLIAPYVMLLALGILHAFAARGAEHPRGPGFLQQAATALGLLVAIGYAAPKLKDGAESSTRMAGMLDRVEEMRRSVRAAGLAMDRVVVFGPVMPVESSLYMAGAHVVAQVLPRSFAAFASMPAERQLAFMRAQFSARARVGLATGADGSFRIVVLPPP